MPFGPTERAGSSDDRGTSTGLWHWFSVMRGGREERKADGVTSIRDSAACTCILLGNNSVKLSKLLLHIAWCSNLPTV